MFACVFVVLTVVGFSRCTDESGCIQMSKYDYDYKMLKQMVKLETENEQLRDRLAAAERIFDAMSSKVDEIDELKRTLEMMANTDRTAGGAVYIRFGQNSCPENGTELVYTGYVGGSYYTHSGAAANYLCLTKEPTWNQHDGSGGHGFVYGAEYEIFGTPSTKLFKQILGEKEPPCAVCRSTRASVIMIPGTDVCTEGWTREYAGYLVSGHYNHNAASEYVCLDSKATVAQDSSASSHDGKLMYTVVAKCGSLKCPPYVENKEITCAVCSK